MRSMTRGRSVRPLLLASPPRPPSPPPARARPAPAGRPPRRRRRVHRRHPAPTKDAGDVVRAAYHEVQTLDPIYAFDLPEAAGISAMCDSLLRMNNDMSYGNGLGTMTQPSDTEYDFAINAPRSSGTVGGHRRRRRLQPRAPAHQGARRLLRRGLRPGQDDRGRQRLHREDHADAARLLAARRAVLRPPARSSRRSSPRRRARRTALRPADHVPGVMKLDSWQTGAGVKMVPNTAYWDTSIPEAEADQSHPPGRARRRGADPPASRPARSTAATCSRSPPSRGCSPATR